MFVQQKKLTVLNVPSNRVATVHRSVTDIQLALPELPSQMASAFLVLLKGAGKVQVLIGLFMAESGKCLFYVSENGEVPLEQMERELEEGQEFAESMGFVLADTDFNLMTASEQESFWKELPICRRHAPVTEPRAIPAAPVTPSARPLSQTPPSGMPSGGQTERKPVSVPAAAVETKPQVAPPQTERAAPASFTVRPERPKVDIATRRQQLKEHLGRFFASL